MTGEAGSESLTDAVDHIPQDYSGLPQASDGHPQAEPLLEALDENWNGEHGGATLREYAAAMNHCARCGIEDFDQRPLKRSEKIN